MVTAVTLDGCQRVSGRGSVISLPKTQRTLKLVAEYRKNKLEDISTDGRLLFYQTSTPIRTYTIPLDSSQGRANEPEVYDDVLRVVELRSAREISRISTISFPYSAQFIPGTHQVFYSEQRGHAKAGLLKKLWNPTSGQVTVCLEELDLQNEALSSITIISPQKAIGALWQKSNGGELLVTLT
jgi:hypothetical protein